MSAYRRKAFEEHGEECYNCGSSEAVEVHHRDGDRGNNRISNLLPLCRRCHRRLHSTGLDGLEEELLPKHERSQLDAGSTTYQFAIDDETWSDWKDTVPRSKALNVRLVELIEADVEGRVAPIEEDRTRKAAETTDSGGQQRQPLAADTRERLREELAGSGDLLEKRVAVIEMMYEVLRDRGEVEKGELLDAVDLDGTGYASRESVWSNMVKGKDTLSALPGVEPPPTGRSEWRYSDA